MYTDLPKVNHLAEVLKNEANQTQVIKIKLLRANIFTSDGLLQFPIPDVFKVNSVNIGVDRMVSLMALMPLEYHTVLNWITRAFVVYLQQRSNLLASVLSQSEMKFLMTRPGLFFSIEFLPAGHYTVRI